MVSHRVTHPRAFAYKFGGDEDRPSLRFAVYMPRDLMNCTIASFYKLDDTELTKRQICARRIFIRLFQRHAARPFAAIPQEELLGIISMFLMCLDEFFFFGSFKSNGRSERLIHSIYITEHYETRGDVLGVVNYRKWIIRVSRYHNYKPFSSLEYVVTSLVHEMIHVFLVAYSCMCRHCEAEGVEGIGRELGLHGRAFLVISFAIVSQLSMNWDPSFAIEMRRVSFWIPWRNYWAMSVDRRDNTMGQGSWTGANVDDIAYKCIRALPNDIHIDQPRLRYFVLQTAASPREPLKWWIDKID